MRILRTRPTTIAALALTASSLGALAMAQSVTGGFGRFWGANYAPLTTDATTAPAAATGRSAIPSPDAGTLAIDRRPVPFDARSRLVHWNSIAIDTSGVDHTPVAPGEDRIFGEQLGPGRASRAMAIVHIAIFDAVNAIFNEWQSYTDIPPSPPGASVDAAIAQAAHDTLVSLFPSQANALNAALTDDLARLTARNQDGGRLEAGRRVGRRAAAAILALRQHDGSERPEPRLGVDFFPSNEPGKWRQDPVSRIPVALGAYWGQVKPFVIESGKSFRVPPPPALTSRAYAAAFDEVKRLGGDGTTTATERTEDQTFTGIYWAYDGTPSLCAPPRLYNQITIAIADQMGSDFFELTRLLALVNVAMADSGIAIWESKYFYQLWRPVTGIREADREPDPRGWGTAIVRRRETPRSGRLVPRPAIWLETTSLRRSPPTPQVTPDSAGPSSKCCGSSIAPTTSGSRSRRTNSTA